MKEAGFVKIFPKSHIKFRKIFIVKIFMKLKVFTTLENIKFSWKSFLSKLQTMISKFMRK